MRPLEREKNLWLLEIWDYDWSINCVYSLGHLLFLFHKKMAAKQQKKTQQKPVKEMHDK